MIVGGPPQPQSTELSSRFSRHCCSRWCIWGNPSLVCHHEIDPRCCPHQTDQHSNPGFRPSTAGNVLSQTVKRTVQRRHGDARMASGGAGFIHLLSMPEASAWNQRQHPVHRSSGFCPPPCDRGLPPADALMANGFRVITTLQDRSSRTAEL